MAQNSPPKKPADAVSGADLGAREKALRKDRGFLRFLRILGPGITVGASDDDPSGIGTYAVAGATFGYAMLWTALITVPMMTAVQYVAAKVGLVTGEGLSGNLRKYYPRWIGYTIAGAVVL